MWECCETREGDLYIERAPHLFKHVLAYVIDDTYPFPAQYEQELRFYGVPYKQETLYLAERKVMDELATVHSSLKRVCSYNEVLLVTVRDMAEREMCVRECKRCNSRKDRTGSLCLKCDAYCVVDHCKTKCPATQYCSAHFAQGTFCNTKYCSSRRLPSSTGCLVHTGNKQLFS